MVFILYKLYILSLTLSLTLPLTGNILHFYIFKKTLLSMIYTLFSSWGLLAGPHNVGDFQVLLYLWGHLVHTM